MRDYLEELLAGTEDALDQAEAEWTEGVSPPLPVSYTHLTLPTKA